MIGLEPCSDIDHCPVDTALSVLGGKWKAMILFHLRTGPKRFNALRRLMPSVTQRMMTAHLRELERDGMVLRVVDASASPPAVEYSLTELGSSLTPILTAMAEWGRLYELRWPAARTRAFKVNPAAHATGSAASA